MLYNLLSNSLKFTHQGFVSIILEKETDGGAKITVEDSGPGIALKDQTAIFQPYEVTGRALDKGGSKGTGLGLAISKQLVEMHGGKIWVESEPGKGARFIVSLPTAPPTPMSEGNDLPEDPAAVV